MASVILAPYLVGVTHSPANAQCADGFRSRVEEAGIGPIEVGVANFRYDDGHRAIVEIFDRPNRPAASFFAHDLAAPGAIDHCANLACALRKMCPSLVSTTFRRPPEMPID